MVFIPTLSDSVTSFLQEYPTYIVSSGLILSICVTFKKVAQSGFSLPISSDINILFSKTLFNSKRSILFVCSKIFPLS